MTGPLVLAFGDSLTAGYGLSAAQSFPAQLEARLRRHRPGALVMNAGLSGDTTGAALARLPRVLSSLRQRPDLAIVELGANDLIRGLPPEGTRANLHAILDELARCGIPALVAGMRPPPFLGPDFAAFCEALYAGAAARTGAAHYPHFLDGATGPGMTIADRLHPNARAIGIVADRILPAVEAALDAQAARAA